MQITQIIERTVPIASPMRNSVIDFSQMTASIVAVVTDVIRDGSPVIGYGFNSNGRYAQGEILRERIIPRLWSADRSELVDIDRDNVDPFGAWDVMMRNEKPGGHGDRSVAVGTIDMALWDIVGKIEERPLYQVLAERFSGGVTNPEVEVYAAGGYYYPDGNDDALKSELSSYRDRGYQSVKMKVGGESLADDLRRIEAALEVVTTPRDLAIDANGRFTVADAIEFLGAIDGMGLKWYEEPIDPLDFEGHATIAAESTTPIATGENIFSLADARNLIRHGGLQKDRDLIQIDPVLSYGLVEYLRILAALDEHGWSRRQCIPHGGHQFALHIAAGLGTGGNESYPNLFKPFGGFADNASLVDGHIRIGSEPGIGIEAKSDLVELFHDLVQGAS